jgi:GR25 family glycosyltransferase involved in LPS biosynthesis
MMNNTFLILFILLLFYILNYIFLNINENFDNINTNIFIINLNRSKDRLENIKKDCKNANINFIRWNAVDGSKLNLNELISNKQLDPNNKMMIGAIGCSLSHISLWNYSVNQNKNVLVLEDDVIIPKDFKNKIKIYLNQLPNKWDMLYLGASNINGEIYSENLIRPNIMDQKSSTHNTGMYAILIHKDFLKKLIKFNIPIEDNIDQVIKNKLFNNSDIFICNPPLIKHNNNIPSMRRVLSNKSSTTKWFSNVQDKIVVTNYKK